MSLPLVILHQRFPQWQLLLLFLSLSCHCLSLSSQPLSFPIFYSRPTILFCKSASELYLSGLKIPAPWQCSVTCLSGSYLIRLSLLFWLIFPFPIIFSLSYVILTWLCQDLIWHFGPMVPHSKSPQYSFNMALIQRPHTGGSHNFDLFFSPFQWGAEICLSFFIKSLQSAILLRCYRNMNIRRDQSDATLCQKALKVETISS